MNRKLAALASFCEFHARHGVTLAGLLETMQPAGRRGSATSYKPFLHHITKNQPQRRAGIKLKASRPRPEVLTASAGADDPGRLRSPAGPPAVRAAAGLRGPDRRGPRPAARGHGDRERTVAVVPRPNDNRARAKAGISRTIPASAELMRLYADYLTREYGALDSDYVFVNLWAEPHGRPLDLRCGLRPGAAATPTAPVSTSSRTPYRHTYATWLLRRGAGMESVKELLGHASITTTIDTYGHLTVEDARRTLEAAGWFTGREVRL